MALGATLREAREKMGLTHKQVADDTHMMTQMVEEIENEDFHRICAAIYGKGFIKLYANYVGLDPEPLIAEFMRVYAKSAETPKPIVTLEQIDTEDSPGVTKVTPEMPPQAKHTLKLHTELPVAPAPHKLHTDAAFNADQDIERPAARVEDDAPVYAEETQDEPPPFQELPPRYPATESFVLRAETASAIPPQPKPEPAPEAAPPPKPQSPATRPIAERRGVAPKARPAAPSAFATFCENVKAIFAQLTAKDSDDEASDEDDDARAMPPPPSHRRYYIIGGSVTIVLLLLLAIISGGGRDNAGNIPEPPPLVDDTLPDDKPAYAVVIEKVLPPPAGFAE